MAPTSNARQRYEYVDLIRGFAALSVLILHYRWFYAAQPDSWPELDSVALPYDWLLHPIYAHGNIAVQMFWLLSGFVFAVTYAEQDKRINVAHFALQRFARLYPPHLATLLYVAALQSVSMALYGSWTVYGHNDGAHFVAQLFLASNWFSHDGSFNGPIWSVSVEVLVYAAFVAYLKFFGNRAGAAATIAMGMFILERITKLPVAMCGALFFAGVVMAPVANQLHRTLGRMMLPASLAALAVAIALSGLAAVWIGSRTEALVVYGVLPLALLSFIAMDRTLPALPQGFRWIGAITFSLYLIHMPLLITIRVMFPAIPASVLSGPYLLPAFGLAAIGLAALSFRHFEMPMQQVIRAWTSSSISASRRQHRAFRLTE